MAYKWKLTAKKFLWASIEVIVVGLLVYFTERPEFLALVPICEALKNWIKHRNK